MKSIVHSPLKLLVLLLVVDAVFFTATNPSTASSYMLIIGFLLLVATIYVGVQELFRFAKLYGIKVGKHQKRLSIFITAVIGGMLALQSMGELSPKDSFVIVPLAALLYLYLSYGRGDTGESPTPSQP